MTRVVDYFTCGIHNSFQTQRVELMEMKSMK